MTYNPTKCLYWKSLTKRSDQKSTHSWLALQSLNRSGDRYFERPRASWDKYIKGTVIKENGTFGFLCRTLMDCTPPVKCSTNRIMVRPILEYGTLTSKPISVHWRSLYVINDYTSINQGYDTKMLCGATICYHTQNATEIAFCVCMHTENAISKFGSILWRYHTCPTQWLNNARQTILGDIWS